jgi:hypothetical protein
MRYLDTSVLLAFLVTEEGSSAAEALMTSDGAPLGISTWTEVELMSALGVKIRSKQLSEREALSVVDVYRRRVLPCLRRVHVGEVAHRRAAGLLDGWRTALRAGDGLHLAIADSHRATIYTFDHGMAKAGAILGIAVSLVEIT